jgi:hypothetical protein
MTISDILILLLFAAYSVYRFILVMRDYENRPGIPAAAGIILCVILALGSAGALMALSLFY